jgi:rhamnose utilization protein RhaD (predicted bifunctional aldolase and dehydrogenase)/NAD(P)-dependent dehydrogenase (short-subunit alcohol dehydrogenase family)
MFENNWNQKVAEEFVSKNSDKGFNEDIAYRVYSSQLIGKNPDLVMHGGGNTSCKTTQQDIFNENIDVLCVKGSGWDLASIEAPGLPAVRLAPLIKLRKLDTLSDEDMVSIQRSNLLKQSAPNPSVETLLHAFLPHKFVDHTHSTPFLVLANLPDAKRIVEDLFGDTLAVVPYVMPGFELAKLAADTFEKHPNVEGLLLEKHGHFAWGTSAKISYDRVVEQTNKVDDWIKTRRKKNYFQSFLPEKEAKDGLVDDLQAALRRVSEEESPSFVFRIIDTPEIISQINEHIKNDMTDRGVATPDHVIRLKPKPLVLKRIDFEKGVTQIEQTILKFVQDYKEYFILCSANSSEKKVMLDVMPKHVWVEDIGLIGIGRSSNEAELITDLASQNIRVISDGQQSGGFFPVKGKDLFDMEYWSLEQAKLGKQRPPSLQGKVVIITGAAGGIGSAIVREFESVGAEVVAVDVDQKNMEIASKTFGKNTTVKVIDLTDEKQVVSLLQEVHNKFGVLDILVSNAGTAPQGAMLEIDIKELKKSFEINFFAHWQLASRVGRMFLRQENKGQMLFNISKQAVNPGRNFGAYGLPKATLMFLVKQLALELGEHGIRVNGINADRIRSGIVDNEFIKARAMSRSISEEKYMKGNLLQAEVEACHVAKAFLDLALNTRTTGHVMTVDGGNVEASLR